MIRITFFRGSNIRNILVKKRIISFMFNELNFQPYIIDLDKIEEKREEIEKKFGDDGLENLRKVSLLISEEEIINDIINDYKKDGWRILKRE